MCVPVEVEATVEATEHLCEGSVCVQCTQKIYTVAGTTVQHVVFDTFFFTLLHVCTVYRYVCTCGTYICMYVCTCTHTYIHTYIHTYSTSSSFLVK